MSLPQPLMFTIGLIDQITKPIAKISHSLNSLSSDYQTGTMKMASGVAGIAASGYALYEALEPALEIDKALGEAKGVGLTDSALKSVTDTAMGFSLQFGKSSVDVIKHAEKMRGVFGNVSDSAIASITNSSATLGMVVQSDADTISKYFKNIYGNNGNLAKSLGQDKFIQQIAGMTAFAKQKFGTEFSELEGMMDGMHSLPSTLGVPLEEQFAVLTMLNKQMSQGDAVTQYTNYLEKLVSSQDKLGVKLTDSNGKMLPIIETMQRLKPLIEGKSGDQAWKLLDDAGLGDGSLLIINAIKNLGELERNIKGFKNVNGLDPATEAAMDMTVQSERLAQSWYVIRAAWGAAILPAFNDFVGIIADMGTNVVWFTEQFPTLTRWIGYAAVAVLGLVAAGGLFTVIMGASKMAMVAWGVAAMTWTGITTALSAGLSTLRSVMLALNIAMYANPIGLIVAAIAAAVVAVGALIYYWDDLKASFADISWINVLLTGLEYAWKAVEVLFAPLLWAIEELADLAGIELDTSFEGMKKMIGVEAIAPLEGKTVKGGITQQISNANQQKSTSVGTVNVYPAKGDSSYMNFVEMHS